ncbi:MAG: reverse transcriptase family protein [bacterium]|nr:reverse transcriptase family protein [bacterium]
MKTDPANVNIREGLDFTLRQLRKIELDKVKSALNQTHYKDICVDTCFLHTAKKLQKKSAEGRHFYGLVTEEGITVRRSFEIVKEIRKQMGDLFTSKCRKKEDMVPFVDNLPQFSEDQQEELNSEITEEEIISALTLMGRGKTPGSDGLPVEFYLAFQALIIPFLIKLFKECFYMGYMSTSMHYGIVTLLYKGKGLRSERANWRPLTMLNVDYKALAKVLTKRVGSFMSYLVHPNQTCAVPGRDIRDSLLSLYNTVQTVINNDDEGILLSLDHQTAFDIIEWEFVFEALKGYNFGEKFISWIKTIYNSSKAHSSVQVNNFVSASFSVTRGIRQGCPLSPTLYVLVAETVANYIRRDILVRGVQIFQEEQKLNSYADDITLILRNFASVLRTFGIFDNFQSASGATLKVSKTQLMLLGRTRNIPCPRAVQEVSCSKVKNIWNINYPFWVCR